MQAIDDSTDAIASRFSCRPRHRNASRPHHRRAGIDQSRPSSGSRHAFDCQRRQLGDRVDRVDQFSFQAAKPNRGLGSGKAEGPGGFTPWPCNSDSPSTSEPGTRLPGIGAPRGHASQRDLSGGIALAKALAWVGVKWAKAGGWQ